MYLPQITTLTNDVVSFEQSGPAPEVSIHINLTNDFVKLTVPGVEYSKRRYDDRVIIKTIQSYTSLPLFPPG